MLARMVKVRNAVVIFMLIARLPHVYRVWFFEFGSHLDRPPQVPSLGWILVAPATHCSDAALQISGLARFFKQNLLPTLKKAISYPSGNGFRREI
jgi:hypothetical protein